MARVYVRDKLSGKVLREFEVGNPSPTNHERFMMGLIRNLAVDRCYVDDSEVESRPPGAAAASPEGLCGASGVDSGAVRGETVWTGQSDSSLPDLAAIRAEASHHERGHNVLNDKQCGICQEPWPCLVARLDKGLDAQAERLVQLNQALEVSAAMYERDVSRLQADLATARSALAEAEQYHDRSVRESALELFEARASDAEQRGRAERLIPFAEAFAAGRFRFHAGRGFTPWVFCCECQGKLQTDDALAIQDGEIPEPADFPHYPTCIVIAARIALAPSDPAS